MKCLFRSTGNGHIFGALFADFGGEYRAKPVPPEADCFMADVDATFVQQVFNISKRKWKSDIYYYRKPDDFGRSFEVFEWVLLCHPIKLWIVFQTTSSSDNASGALIDVTMLI